MFPTAKRAGQGRTGEIKKPARTPVLKVRRFIVPLSGFHSACFLFAVLVKSGRLWGEIRPFAGSTRFVTTETSVTPVTEIVKDLI